MDLEESYFCELSDHKNHKNLHIAQIKTCYNNYSISCQLINIKSPRLSHEATSQAVNIAKNRYANINACKLCTIYSNTCYY